MTLSKYDEIMDRVKIDENMRRRILSNISTMRTPRRPSMIRTGRIIAAAACIIIIGGGIAAVVIRHNKDSQIQQSYWQIKEASSLEELSETVGFTVNELEYLPFDVTETDYFSYLDETAEIVYTGDDNVCTYRVSPGNEDNSGDYNFYDSETTMEIDGLTVTLKGSDDSWNLAIWTDNGFSYSVHFEEGISTEAVKDLF